MCDIGNVFDLVVILLLFLFDRDYFCNLCGCKKSLAHPIRFVIFAVTTTAQWVIISQTDKKVIEDFTRETDDSVFEDEPKRLVIIMVGFTGASLLFIFMFIFAYVKPEKFTKIAGLLVVTYICICLF